MEPSPSCLPPAWGDAAGVLAAAVCWRAAYLEAGFHVRRRRPALDWPGAASRAASTAHALLSVLAAALAPDFCGAWGAALRLASAGYLVHDAHLVATTPSLKDPGMLAHHAFYACLVFFGLGLAPRAVVARALWAEAPVPFLNLGWLLVRGGGRARAPRLFAANSAAVLGLFLATRLWPFAWLAAAFAGRRAWISGLFAGLFALNAFWFAKLCRLAGAALRPPPGG